MQSNPDTPLFVEMPSISAIFTLGLIALLVTALYRDWTRPSLAFISTAFVLILFKIISVEEFLAGLANKQIILIFLLIVLTAGIQKNIGSEFFYKLFHKNLSPKEFRIRLMTIVGGASALMNNTPIVAFMIPYVKEWAESNKYAASKFLIPLSFATILGGTITVIGTSTNLVLNGLIGQYGLPLLGFYDFFFLGLLVSVAGILYMGLASDRLLPDREERRDQVMQHLNEYLVETLIAPGSRMIGKTVKEAGLRNLKEMFLVEISRKERNINPVSPQETIREDDRLFFSGNTKAIFSLIREANGLSVPEESHISDNGFFHLMEAVVPSSSSLIGQKIKNSNFRERYKASIISIFRKGEQLKGNIGETRVQAGDMFLMLCGSNGISGNARDLILVTLQEEKLQPDAPASKVPSLLAILALLGGIVGLLDLFLAALIGIFLLYGFKIINITLIRKSIDIDLLAVLVSSLAIGVALSKSGAAGILVNGVLLLSEQYSTIVSIALLFFITLILTTLITNAAAVSMMFPIAMELGTRLEQPLTPFFVAIAFAASGDFMTPIGYQTNLMVMGPGNYRFKDYFKLGFPLTTIYTGISLGFIHWYYLE